MVPIPNAPPGALRFGSSPTSRHLAQGAVLVALLLGAAAGAGGLLGPSERLVAGVLCALLLVTAAGASWWRVHLAADAETRVYTLRRGWRWLHRTRRGPVSEIGPLRLHAERRVDLAGLRWTRWSVIAEGLPGRPKLLETDDAQSARQAAERWASALAVPLVESRMKPFAPGRAARAVVAATATLAALGALSAVLWPALQRSSQLPARAPLQAAHQGHFQRALNAYELRDFRQAERLLRQAVHADPQQSHVRIMLAYALAEQDRLDEALAEVLILVRAAPGAASALSAAADAHVRRGGRPAADYPYEMALRDPDTPKLVETHAKLGVMLLVVGQPHAGSWNLRVAARHPHNRWGAFAAGLLERNAGDEAPAMNPRTPLDD
ncbi:MAG TPA: tetratricopeptide repeat protein [Chthonomonadales bacterium]|nr:tetratricopeptide repeat protein [Chthonomonadales bacterium]